MTDSLADAASKAVKPTQVLRGELRRNIYLTIEYVVSMTWSPLDDETDCGVDGCFVGSLGGRLIMVIDRRNGED